jgi:CheY-like chemotaxis protein
MATRAAGTTLAAPRGRAGWGRGSRGPAGPAGLVVEDDAGVVALRAAVLAGAGDAPTTDSALGAVALIRRLRPAVVLLDLGLPSCSGPA